jgi:hypothetical protein
MLMSDKCSAIMLLLTTSIIQWHPIQFLIGVADSIGVLWSITIEAPAICLWWHKKTVLAFIASIDLVPTIQALRGIHPDKLNSISHGKFSDSE